MDSIGPVPQSLVNVLNEFFPWLFNPNSDPTGARSGDVGMGLTGDLGIALNSAFANPGQADDQAFGGALQTYTSQDAAKALLGANGSMVSGISDGHGGINYYLGGLNVTNYVAKNPDGSLQHEPDGSPVINYQGVLEAAIAEIQAGDVA